jgi:hypothetical protein
LTDVPTTVLVAVVGVVVVVVVVVVGEVVEVECAGAVDVVVAACAGGLVVVVVDVLVVPLPARVPPPLAVTLEVRVVVVTPRELRDKVAGLLWKLIRPANPATVATATIPARFMIGVLSWFACLLESTAC